MYWNKIKSEINQRHEYLFRLFVHSKNISTASKIPRILKISSALAADMAGGQTEHQRLAFLFPRGFDSAVWIAVGAALGMIKSDFSGVIENLFPFSKGQKLLLDNKIIVEYDGNKTIQGQTFIWLKLGHQAWHSLPINHRLRLQAVDTKRPLSKPKSISTPSFSALDNLLNIQSFGNRKIFYNRIILVSLMGQTRNFCRDIFVSPSENVEPDPLKDLFQWGSIDIEGNIEPWSSHQVEAEPVIAVASNLSGLREYFQSKHHINPLIILDGSSSFLNNLDSLDDVLATGCPVVSVMEQGEDEGIRLLSERSFNVWVWSKNEIRALERSNSEGHYYKKNSPFTPFQRSIRNYAKREIEPVTCDDSLIQATAEKLNTFTHEISSDKLDIKTLEGMLYGCLLPLAKLVRPVEYFGGTEWKQKIEKRFQRVESKFFRNKLWLTEKEDSFINGLIVDLKKVFLHSNLQNNGKINVFQKLILAHAGGNAAVIVENAEEKFIAENYWKSCLENIDNVYFCGPNTINTEIDYKRMIICGWLGTDKMRLLLDSCLAPKIMVLLYPFENIWLQSVMRKRKRNMVHGLHASEKATFLNINSADYPTDYQTGEYEHEPVGSNKDFDISEFELRHRSQRRTAFANAVSSGEATTEAIQVELSEDRFAFLTKSFKVAVVNDLLSGKATEADEIPRKTVAELKTGDYVIFREGAESDLIREIADRGLEKAGKKNLLQVAGIWKQALRNFEKKAGRLVLDMLRKKSGEYYQGDASSVVAYILKEKGCNRHPQTIRNWLTNDDLIGPRSDKDLQIIADTTGDTELKSRLQDVRLAIKEVRGAHLQASRFLARKLMESLPDYLKSSTPQTMTVEIEGIGNAVVAQVEYVAEKPTILSTAKVNRLLMEEE
jgi:hypothetical protein